MISYRSIVLNTHKNIAAVNRQAWAWKTRLQKKKGGGRRGVYSKKGARRKPDNLATIILRKRGEITAKTSWLDISALLLHNFAKERKTRASYFPIYHILRRNYLRKETRVHCLENFLFQSHSCGLWTGTTLSAQNIKEAAATSS